MIGIQLGRFWLQLCCLLYPKEIAWWGFNLNAMPIKSLSIKTTGLAASAKKSDIPLFSVAGRSVQAYSLAKAAFETADANLKAATPAMKSQGLGLLFGHNIDNPGAPTSSVKLQDESGLVAIVTMQNRYGAPDAEAADAAFTELGADINDAVQMTAVGKFDSGIFISKVNGDKGEFSKKIFTAYAAALEKATAELIAKGLLPADTESPLSTGQVAAVRTTFHAERWAKFPSVAAQSIINEVLPTTVTANVTV